MGGETSCRTERKGGPQLLNITDICAELKSFNNDVQNSSSETYFGTEQEGTVGK